MTNESKSMLKRINVQSGKPMMEGVEAKRNDLGCKKCGGFMIQSKALENNLSGVPDFIGSKEVCTVSPDGTAKLIDCMKCEQCGWSTT